MQARPPRIPSDLGGPWGCGASSLQRSPRSSGKNRLAAPPRPRAPRAPQQDTDGRSSCGLRCGQQIRHPLGMAELLVLLIGMVRCNPLSRARYAEAVLARTETDAADARRIARFCEAHELAPWSPASPAHQRLHALVATRAALLEQVQRLRNRQGAAGF